MGPPTMAPPPPRPAARICNCDSDGECEYCQEERMDAEERAMWDRIEDSRRDCERCAGCFTCQSLIGYDGD